MQHILDNVSISNTFNNTSDVLIAIEPWLVFLLGLLLAFLVVRIIIDILPKKNKKI